jgi:hypothetical protein
MTKTKTTQNVKLESVSFIDGQLFPWINKIIHKDNQNCSYSLDSVPESCNTSYSYKRTICLHTIWPNSDFQTAVYKLN